MGITIVFVLVCFATSLANAQAADGLIWEYSTGDRVNAVATSADGEQIALGARDNTVSILDGDGQLRWIFSADNSVLGLDMSADGQWLGIASEDRNVYLLDGDGDPLWQFRAGRPMNNVAVADDGSLVAATSDDLSVYVLDRDGELLWQETLGIGVQAVAIYGKGEKARVVVGSDDGLVTIYSRDGKALLSEQMDYDVQSLDVTPNGGRILVGTSDGFATLLNGSNGDALWQYATDGDKISVALTADGSSSVVGSAESAYLLDGDGVLVQQFVLGDAKKDDEVLDVAVTDEGNRLVVGTLNARAGLFDRQAAISGSAKAQSQRRWLIGGILLAVVAAIVLFIWVVRSTAAGRRGWQQGSRRPRRLLQEVWRSRLSYLLILPTLLLLTTFNYYPAFSGLHHAFTDWSPGIKSEWVGFANFQFLLQDRFFLAGFRNVIIITVVTIVKTMTVPLLVAELIFNLRSQFSQYWARTLFVVPIVMPLVVIILLWNNIYDPQIGLLNKTLEAIGLGNLTRVWYGDPNVALASVIFINFPWVNAFALLIFYGGLISISDEIIDSSKVDGATTWRRFWSIDLPLLMGQVKLLLILNFINAVQTFELVFLTTGGGPGTSTYTPALELYYMAMRMDRFGVASAIGMVLFVIILAGTVINMRFMNSPTEYEA